MSSRQNASNWLSINNGPRIECSMDRINTHTPFRFSIRRGLHVEPPPSSVIVYWPLNRSQSLKLHVTIIHFSYHFVIQALKEHEEGSRAWKSGVDRMTRQRIKKNIKLKSITMCLFFFFETMSARALWDWVVTAGDIYMCHCACELENVKEINREVCSRKKISFRSFATLQMS